MKQKVQLQPIEIQTVFPYVSEFKEPSWTPLQLRSLSPKIYFPHIKEIKRIISTIDIKEKDLSLKEIYWYLQMKKFLHLGYDNDDQVIYQKIIDKEIHRNLIVGFSDEGCKSPEINSTYYALASLKLLEKIEIYLESNQDLRRRKGIIALLEALNKNTHFAHCLSNKCRTSGSRSEFKYIFYALNIYHLLKIDPRTQGRKFVEKINKTKRRNRIDIVFQLINIHILNLKGNIEEDFLLYFYKFQNEDGGFNLNGNKDSKLYDTMWITYLFEAYKWLIPYKIGPIYGHLANQIEDFNFSRFEKEPHTFVEIGTLIFNINLLFSTLLSKIEDILFNRLESQNILDLREITSEIGIDPETTKNLIPFIDSIYKFSLKIESNQVRFRKYLNKLDPYKQKFAEIIYNEVKKNPIFSITQLRKNYNKKKSKNQKIEDSFLIEIIKELIEDKIIKGNIKTKSLLFFKKHYLTRADLIHNVVISDKDISKSNLNREKQRLKEIKRDIFNMTREMERSARNIAHEVESLILVENVNLAEERMENNIKKAIFDATFFHKNIESFQKEFDLIKPVALEDEIKKWNKVYSRLQHDYRNIKRNLGLKIKDLKKEKIYYNQAIELEDIIAKYTHDLHDDFNKFQEYLKDLINTIDIQEDDNDFIEELLAKLEPIELKLETYDTKINKVSQSIKAEKGETKKIRKKAIDKWITESGEFRNLISYYRDGFTQFAETKEQIEKETTQFINEIETIGKKIHDKIKHKEFQEAYKLTESFRDVYNKIEKVSDTLNENLQKNYKKKRKLYPLFRSIEQEWLMHQNVLEKLTEKFRTEFRSSIDMGLEVHLKEHFISVVNGNITDLRAQFVKIEKELNSFFSKKNYPSKETVYNKLHKLQDHLKTRNEKVIRALDKGKKQSDDFELKIEKTMEKWVNFKNSFSNNINKLQDKLQEELIISAILQKAEIEKKNIFPIKKISRELSKDMDELAQELKKLKAQNRINIKIKDKTDELEIHNEVWRKSQALSQFSRVRIRELNNRCVTINNYLLNSLQHTQFLNDIFQTKDLAEEFKEKINNIKQKWKLKLDDYEVDDSYQLIEEIETKLFEKIKVYEEKSHEILKVCNLVGDFKNYTDQKLVELEDIVNGKIHYLYEEIQDIKIKKYKKNISWFNKEKQKLLNAIKKIEKDVQNKKSSLISKESKIIPAMVSLEEQFSEKKDVLIGNFENAEKDILDKISTLKIDKMKTELEELIQKSQDKLNLNLKKAEDEIRQKIKIQDFISAGKKMGDDFSEDLEDDLKDFDKEIKKLNKGFTKESSIFNIKYSYLIQNWEKFLLEYLNRIQEKDVELQKHMIKEYINMVIDALNEPYMPVDNIARDLKLKENLVKQRLMGLIKQGALSGKIDQKYNIYMKKGITVDKQIVDSLDAMRSKNVRAYLIMRRFGGALRYITPVISLILGIGSYVASQPNTSSAAIIAPIGIAMIILIPIVLYYIYWLYLGRKKALKGNVIVKGGEETQKQENLTVTTQSPPDNVVPGMGYMDEDEDTEKGPDELLEEELTAKTTITDFNADEDDHEGNPTFKKPYEY